ncbi:50S ribosomal protein L25 [Candidatus Margulisiibacteriota bacterium]
MKKNILEATVRKDSGKKSAKKLRAEGMVPAVFYGRHVEKTLEVAVDKKEFTNQVKHSEAGLNTIFTLKIKDEKGVAEEMAMPHKLQYNVLTDEVTHIDFQQIRMKEAITTHVPVSLIGVASGTKMGGRLIQLIDKIEVKCLPLDLPTGFDIEVTLLEIGDGLSVSDVAVSDKVEVLTPGEQLLVHVEGAAKEEEELPVEGEEEGEGEGEAEEGAAEEAGSEEKAEE